MNEDRRRLRWNVERRLAFIELRLYWEGRINRADLVRFFGISVPQASQDIARYAQIAPGNLVYDKTAKTYVADEGFRAVLVEPSADSYLAQMRSLTTGGLGPGDSWIGFVPDFLEIPRLRRHYDPELLRHLIRCIRDGLELDVEYLSFSDAEAKTRTIAPHAFGFDGHRWHVRAFCFRTISFRDFVINRLTDLGRTSPTLARSSWDLEWREPVDLFLEANPRLPKKMRTAIEKDYGMKDGTLLVRTTVCSSYYLESQLNLDLNADALPPKRLQLVLRNSEQVEARRAEVRAMACQVIQDEVPQAAA